LYGGGYYFGCGCDTSHCFAASNVSSAGVVGTFGTSWSGFTPTRLISRFCGETTFSTVTLIAEPSARSIDCPATRHPEVVSPKRRA
jgi:hypothetical protein